MGTQRTASALPSRMTPPYKIRGHWRHFAGLLLSLGLVANALAALPPLPALPPPTDAEKQACTKPGRTAPEVQVCLSPQVWSQAVAGAVQTGLDNKGRPTGRIFHVLVVGPGYGSLPPAVGLEIRKSLQHITANKVAPHLQQQLDNIYSVSHVLEANAKANPKLDVKAELKRLTDAASEQVLIAIQGAVITYQSTAQRLFFDFRIDAPRFRMAISESACLPSDGCVLPAWALNHKKVASQRYSKLRFWDVVSSVPRGNLRAFAQQSAGAALAAGLMQNVRAVPSAATSPAQQVESFERLVTDARAAPSRYARGWGIDSAVPAVVGLNKRASLAVVDLLQSPVTAMSQLPVAGEVALTSISDELARTRITECTKLRGVFAPVEQAAGPRVAEVGVNTCSGYELTPQEITDCVAGRRCFPKIAVGKSLLLDTALIADPRSLSTLVAGAGLPRIKLADDIKQLEAKVNECVKAKRDATNVDLTMCLAEKQAPAEAATYKCTKSAVDLRGKAQADKLRDCLASSLPPHQREQLNCYMNEKSTVDQIVCASKDKLSPEGKAVAECLDESSEAKRSKDNMVQCLAKKQAGNIGKAFACFTDNSDWKAGVTCAMKDQVGGDVSKALDCAEKSNYKAEGTAVCMVKLPGSLGKIATCVAQSQGNPYGTAVCAVGDGLTVDQRIALQCGAQTGGAPPAFAACLVGQMTMKELAYCKGKNFGEGKCFNENNEFRKIFAKAGIPIGPKSVVADVINVHLAYLEAQVKFLSDANEVLKDGIEGAVQVMTSAYQAVWKAQVEIAQAPYKAAEGICNGVAKLIGGRKARC